MELPIPNKLSKLWEALDLRACIILSLFLQAFLVSFAPLRRRSKSTFLLFFVWSAYLLADWVAAVAIGLITQSQTDLCAPVGSINGDLYAFWASFLLLHLGGPDSITSFALEDNEFWLRHFFGLVLQVFGAAYSIFLTLPISNNKLWLPTILIFVVGTVKYGERTYALYLASSDRIGATSLPAPNPGTDYEEAVAATPAEESIHVPSQSEEVNDTLLGDFSSDEAKLLQLARKLVEWFKGVMLLDMALSPEIQAASKRAFVRADPADAVRAVDYELGILYEVLHTKVAVAHSKSGYLIRIISLVFLFCASILFFMAGKRGNDVFDVGLSYVLLIAAVVLDITSVVQILSSDYALSSSSSSFTRYVSSFRYNFAKRRRSRSGSVFQYDFISYCLADERPRWAYNLAGYVKAKGILNTIKIALLSPRSEKVTEDVKQHIFKHLKSLSENQMLSNIAQVFTDESGDKTEFIRSLLSTQVLGDGTYRGPRLLKRFLVTHLATEIYYSDHHHHHHDQRQSDYKTTSKLISNYVFYLLIVQPKLVSPSLSQRNEKEIFEDAVDEVKRYLHEAKISHRSEACENIKRVINSEDLYNNFLDQSRNESVFSQAVGRARNLSRNEMSEEQLMNTWLMILFLAASTCRPALHVQQLSKGGQLTTFAWSLAIHLGLISKLLQDVRL